MIFIFIELPFFKTFFAWDNISTAGAIPLCLRPINVKIGCRYIGIPPQQFPAVTLLHCATLLNIYQYNASAKLLKLCVEKQIWRLEIYIHINWKLVNSQKIDTVLSSSMLRLHYWKGGGRSVGLLGWDQ
jgi:hypothetical protein